jgi:hypothetical protein
MVQAVHKYITYPELFVAGFKNAVQPLYKLFDDSFLDELPDVAIF